MSVAKASGASAIPHRIRFSLTGDGLADAHSCRAGFARCVDSFLESSNVHTSIYKWRRGARRRFAGCQERLFFVAAPPRALPVLPPVPLLIMPFVSRSYASFALRRQSLRAIPDCAAHASFAT